MCGNASASLLFNVTCIKYNLCERPLRISITTAFESFAQNVNKNSRRSGEWVGEGAPFTRYRLMVAGCEGEGEFDCF